MNIDSYILNSDHKDGLLELYNKVLELSIKLPERVPFVEIGTRSGGSALVFLNAIKKSQKYRPFFTIDPYGDKMYLRGEEQLQMGYGESFYREAMLNISNFCYQNKLFHYHFRITSLDFIKIWDNIDIIYHNNKICSPFGFVYLDGDHNENTISKEIEWFCPKIHEDGLIVIDDSEHIINSNNKILKSFIKKSYLIGNRIYGKYI